MVVVGWLNGLCCQRFGRRQVFGALLPTCSKRRGFLPPVFTAALAALLLPQPVLCRADACLPPAAATTPYHGTEYQRTNSIATHSRELPMPPSFTVRTVSVPNAGFDGVCSVCVVFLVGAGTVSLPCLFKILCSSLGRPAGRLAQALIAPVCGLHAVYF